MLRKGQKELVETYRKGYCGVPAIPGGGKTFALTKWAVSVLSEGANNPGKILIVTYLLQTTLSKELLRSSRNLVLLPVTIMFLRFIACAFRLLRISRNL